MKRKIIIDVADGIPLPLAMSCVKAVIEGGRVSNSRGREQFCFLTTFVQDIQVFARLKRNAETDSFRVEQTKENQADE